MKETDYAFATQRLASLGNEIYANGKKILQPCLTKKYDTTPINTAVQKGSILLEEEQKINIISHHEDLMRLGFVIQTDKIHHDNPKSYGVKVEHRLIKIGHGIKPVKFPNGVYIEHDVVNKAIRLKGKNTGRLGVGPWIHVLNKRNRDSDSYDDLMKSFYPELDEEEDLTTHTYISEIPLLISNEGEVICLPRELDEPTFGIVGTKRTGKSLLLHGIVDRAYYKWKILVGVMNDYMNEFHSAALPWIYTSSRNKERPHFAKKLAALNEHTLPLPVVVLTPKTSTSSEVTLPDSGISYQMSFPFKELLHNYHLYMNAKKEWRMTNTGRHFREIASSIADCKNMEEVEGVIDIAFPDKGFASMKNKMKSVVQDIFFHEFVDANTGVPSKWTVKLKDGHVGEYNPIIACLVAGVIPVVQTRDLSVQPYFPEYERYLSSDIFRKQVNNEYFTKKGLRIWQVFDEITAMFEKGRRNAVTSILETCATIGGPARIGLVYATQNYTFVPYRVRTNTKYLIVFNLTSSEEVNAIGKDFNLTKHDREKIYSLQKFECIALTDERFVCYNANGQKRYSKKGEFFRGKIITPLSMHKAPSEEAK